LRTAIIIPARYKSVRFPGKPLQVLTGATGVAKTLIQRSWEAAQEVKGVDEVIVATDDDRIAEAVRAFGGAFAITPESCANGTERCAAALPALAAPPDVVVNLQGDAPLTPPWFVEALIAEMAAHPEVQIATPVLQCDSAAHASFVEDRLAGRVGATTAVFARNHDALYFSKEVLPYTGRTFAAGETPPVFHHVGVYAYRPQALAAYGQWPMGALEKWEGLEQLRFMENGAPVRCVKVEAKGRVFWELNNPVDIARVEAALKADGVA
jgi:3-deoxy-manno-octulosonate cytidylyltransferase (CMP-KDO synthetase)